MSTDAWKMNVAEAVAMPETAPKDIPQCLRRESEKGQGGAFGDPLNRIVLFQSKVNDQALWVQYQRRARTFASSDHADTTIRWLVYGLVTDLEEAQPEKVSPLLRADEFVLCNASGEVLSVIVPGDERYILLGVSPVKLEQLIQICKEQDASAPPPWIHIFLPREIAHETEDMPSGQEGVHNEQGRLLEKIVRGLSAASILEGFIVSASPIAS